MRLLSSSIQVRNPVFGVSCTKQLLALSAVLGLVAWSATVASGANVLSNANLDAIALQDQANPTPLAWTVEGIKSFDGGFNDGGDSEPWCNVVDTGGYGFFFKPFQGSLGPPSNLL